jgi:hypothetical protein
VINFTGSLATLYIASLLKRNCLRFLSKFTWSYTSQHVFMRNAQRMSIPQPCSLQHWKKKPACLECINTKQYLKICKDSIKMSWIWRRASSMYLHVNACFCKCVLKMFGYTLIWTTLYNPYLQECQTEMWGRWEPLQTPVHTMRRTITNSKWDHNVRHCIYYYTISESDLKINIYSMNHILTCMW